MSDYDENPRFLRPFFGYYGGKWRDTPRLYPEPDHEIIVEPFAGSAGYSLRFFDRTVVLCEKDPILVAIWTYLIDVEPEEILRLPDIEPGESVDDLPICQEAKWLIGFWLNRGVSRPRKSPSKWMRDRIRPGSFWGDRVRNTIARQVPRIRHWKIRNHGYESCDLEKKATWFVDPPYQIAGQHYRFGPDSVDYDHLGDWCRSRIGQVIVCENEGAEWLPFRPLAKTKTTRPGRSSREVIWTNRLDPE